MSHPQGPHRHFFAFGNPFRMMLPKGSYLSPRHLSLLNAFEETLAQQLRKLKPGHKDDVLSFSWMKLAMELLCETHNNIKNLITELEFPVCDWDDKWVDDYLNNSVKLLDICIAFSSEISRMNQGHLLLQCALHHLKTTPTELVKARTSLDQWSQHINAKNPKIDNCFAILESLDQSLNLPKIKNSGKGKVLMRAMYGVKVETVFVCGVFASAFTGSAKKLTDLHVPSALPWALPFAELQTEVNTEIRSIYSVGRSTVFKELEAVDFGVKSLYLMTQQAINHVEAEEFQSVVLKLGSSCEKLSQGLDHLAKEVDGFFQIVLTGRDALLCNLRVGDVIFDDPKLVTKAEQQDVK